MKLVQGKRASKKTSKKKYYIVGDHQHTHTHVLVKSVTLTLNQNEMPSALYIAADDTEEAERECKLTLHDVITTNNRAVYTHH